MSVISVTSTMPVMGARTVAAKSAPMPAMAKAPGSMPRSGKAAWNRWPKITPNRVPSARVGAKTPPGAPEQKQMRVAISRTEKMRKRVAIAESPPTR
ncbi:hypothetical protein D3C75_1206890 [compost metagenome]